jgi:hypothetical protein
VPHVCDSSRCHEEQRWTLCRTSHATIACACMRQCVRGVAVHGSEREREREREGGALLLCLAGDLLSLALLPVLQLRLPVREAAALGAVAAPGGFHQPKRAHPVGFHPNRKKTKGGCTCPMRSPRTAGRRVRSAPRSAAPPIAVVCDAARQRHTHARAHTQRTRCQCAERYDSPRIPTPHTEGSPSGWACRGCHSLLPTQVHRGDTSPWLRLRGSGSGSPEAAHESPRHIPQPRAATTARGARCPCAAPDSSPPPLGCAPPARHGRAHGGGEDDHRGDIINHRSGRAIEMGVRACVRACVRAQCSVLSAQCLVHLLRELLLGEHALARGGVPAVELLAAVCEPAALAQPTAATQPPAPPPTKQPAPTNHSTSPVSPTALEACDGVHPLPPPRLLREPPALG